MKKKSMLIVAILLMSIGFAAISTTLIINGNAKVSENNEDFSVIFTAASIDGNDVYSTAVDETKKTITFTTSELKTLNQTSVLTYEVTNNSSNYDAEVNVTCVPKEGTTAKYTSIKNKLDNDATVVKAKETLNGTLTVTLDKVATESVTEEYTCKLEFNAVERDTLGSNIPTPISFESDSWATIAANVKSGNTSKYNVGDTKEVDLGTTYGTHTIRIANMSTPSECSTSGFSQTACGFVLEFADIITTHNMNPAGEYNGTQYDYGYNVGGWPNSSMRTFVNNDIYNSLPSDLKNGIIDTTVVSSYGKSDTSNFTSTDKLYLLAPKEIYTDFNNSYDTAKDLTRQLDYYKNEGVTTSSCSKAIKINNSTASYWWLRSAKSVNISSFYFVYNAAGDWNTGTAYTTDGVSPAFRMG